MKELTLKQINRRLKIVNNLLSIFAIVMIITIFGIGILFLPVNIILFFIRRKLLQLKYKKMGKQYSDFLSDINW